VIVFHPPIDILEWNSALSSHSNSEKYAFLKNKRYLITVSRLVERKGHAQVIKAMSMISDHCDLYYVITGEGEYKSHLKTLAKEYNLSKKVVFTGFVSLSDLNYLYQNAELYISPSLDVDGDIEGFGISIIEAALHKIPSIAGNTGGVSDAITNNKTGVIVNAVDLNAIATAITTMTQNESLRKSMGLAACEKVKSEFSLISQSQKLKKIIDLIL
jgi:phosphatidyl-myo-inositol dimannoside synthase